MKELLVGAVAGLVFICVAMLLSNDDFDQQHLNQRHYCDMVKMWQANNHLPETERPGWPPYKGECHED